MDYKQKYLKYKQKYLFLKMIQNGGGKTILTQENTKIEQTLFENKDDNKIDNITDKDIIDLFNKAYNTNITEFIPHSDKGGEAIVWKILYDNKLAGFGVTTDLAQFEKYDNFEAKGGIRNEKGLYITSVAGDPIYSGIVSLLFKKINEYAIKNDYDYLLLEAKKYEDNYLVKLYEKQGFTPITELIEEGETGTLMSKDVKDKFNSVDKIKKNLKLSDQ